MPPSTLRRLFGLGLLLGAVPWGNAARAQSGGAPGAVTGIAYDSVRGRALGGAQIEVEGTTIVTLAGADGRFHLDSVPAGQRRLRAHHAVLDTLGIGLVAEYKIVAGQTVKTELATPAPETLVNMFCSARERFLGPSALFGRVRDADTGEPTANAVVELVWFQVDLTGLRKQPHQKLGTVAPDGTYRVCGLPRSMDAKAQVRKNGVPLGGEIPVVFNDDVLRLRSMSTNAGEITTDPITERAAAATSGQPPIVPPGGPPPVARPDSIAAKPPVTETRADSTRVSAPAPAPAATGPRPRPGRAKLSGTVLSEAGAPLAGARVQLDGNARTALTNQRGTFSLDSLPSGSQVLTVRLLGYTPGTKEVELSVSDPQTTTITLGKVVPTLTTVVAQASRDRGLDAVGFTQRKKAGIGWYADEELIRKHGGSTFTELIRMNPSVRIDPSGTTGNVILNAREPVTGCVMTLIDGSPFQQMTPGDIDQAVRPEDIGAIEVYSGSQAPAEFQQAGMSGCLTIVIWTKWKLNQRGKR